MIRKSIIIISLLVSVNVSAQNYSDEILMTIHNRNITLGEFERIYNKNNSNPSIEQQSVDEYLELFINFKLKVIEAEEMGLDTTQAFIREFNGYKKQLARPYLSDKEEVAALVKQAFDRAQTEIHVSHILLSLNAFASPEDTLKLYKKALDIRNRIIAGEDFTVVAKATSDDPSVKTNNGDLGYFTVFRMIYPFESAAYATPVGQISMPVRTRFGYHLIKVLDKRPARGEVRVAHIMVLTPETMTDQEKVEAKKKIYQYYDSIKAGADFTMFAQKYSEDRGSAARGGELQWFGTGRMVPEFENAAFALKKPGDLSAPIQTSFGWHLIKLLEKKYYDNYDSVKAEFETFVSRSDRSVYSKKALVGKIKKQYGFKEYPEKLRDFYSVVDTTVFQNTWDQGKAVHLKDILFTIGDRNILQKDFANYINQNQRTREMDIVVFVNMLYTDFLEKEVLQYEEDQLPEKYPEFKYLIEEYHDGILLFDLTDQIVWSKAVRDTAGLLEFYKQHKNDYMWEKRLDATIFSCRDEEIANKAKSLLLKKSKKKPSPDQVVQAMIKESGDSTCISYENGFFETGDNDYIGQMNWDLDISDNMPGGDKIIFIRKNAILKPMPKKLDEARGLITADYQTYLEKRWIEELRNKYEITVNRDLLSKIE